MAPAESYLDINTNRFSRFVNLTYPDDDWHEEFTYHGANVYAYILAKWGAYIDFICIQFYEGYSHADYQISQLNVPPATYIYDYVSRLRQNGEGYTVNFEDDPDVDLTNQFIDIPMDKLVIGLANGWAVGSDKFIFIDTKDVHDAYNSLVEEGGNICPFRGFMYWVIDEEGTNDVDFASALNKIVGVRSKTPGTSRTFGNCDARGDIKISSNK